MIASIVAALLVATPVVAQLIAPKAHPSGPVAFPQGVEARSVQIKLKLSLDEQGKVSDVEVVARIPDDAPDAYVARALEYVDRLQFDPATKNGQPIPAIIPYTVVFEPPVASAVSVSASAASSASSSSTPVSPTPKTKNEVAAAIGDEKEGERHPNDEVVNLDVIGRTEPRSRGVSDFHIHFGALALVPRANATDLLKLAPGILLTNEGGEGHAEQVFLRGFDAREGQDLEFSVGGVPINDSGNLHGNGYADTHFVIPELVTALRVVEGPFSPAQGNYAVAGSADYELGLERRGLTTKYTFGSFGTQRLLLLWGPEQASTHTFGGVEVYETQGFGQNRGARRGTAMGQYEGSIGERGSYRITTTAYATSFHSAGVLREDDYDSGRMKFFDSYDSLQGGDSSRYSIAGDYESASDDITYRQLIFFIDRGMRLRENFTGFLLDPQTPLQTPHPQRGDLLDLDSSALTLGARGSARFKGKAFGLPQELELGYFARGDRTTSTQYRIEAATGHPYRLENDLTSKLGDLGLFVDANVKFFKWMTLRGGLRADVFTYDVLDGCAVHDVAHPSKTNPPGDSSCLSQEGLGRYREPTQRSSTAAVSVLPRGSLIFGPIDGFTFSFSYGRGVRSIDPSYVTQDQNTPFAAITAYEGGVGYVKTTDHLTLTARSIFFQTKVDRDLVFSETQGRNTLGGGSTRTGWVGALRATGDFFDEAANMTMVRSEFDDTHLLIPYVPDLVIRSDSAVFHAIPWFTIGGEHVVAALGAGVTYVGHRALPYGQRSDVVFTVDTTGSLSWKGYEVSLTATNLLGRRYRLGEFDYASDFHSQGQPTLVPMRHFTAGAPRAIFLSFAATFGGGK